MFASSAHYPLTGQRRGLRSRYANARNAKTTTTTTTTIKAMALGDGIYDPPNSKDEAFRKRRPPSNVSFPMERRKRAIKNERCENKCQKEANFVRGIAGNG